MFIGKWKAYYYNQVLCVLLWQLRVLVYRCMYWLVSCIFKIWLCTTNQPVHTPVHQKPLHHNVIEGVTRNKEHK